MPLIQLNLPEKEDSQIQHFMVDNKIIDKRIAIVELIKRYFHTSAKK